MWRAQKISSELIKQSLNPFDWRNYFIKRETFYFCCINGNEISLNRNELVIDADIDIS